LLPPEPDRRPLLPPPAAARWGQVVAEWPVLEAEWLAVAAAAGWRPAPDVLVAMLRRHQRAPLLATAVLAWGGACAAWLVDHLPELTPTDATATPPRAELRPLPVPAELEPLLVGAHDRFATALAAGLFTGEYRWSHRAVLLNAVARVDADALPAVIVALEGGRDRLDAAGDDAAPLSVWEALLELARARREMLLELEPPAGVSTP
jgi:hypothetical protein